MTENLRLKSRSLVSVLDTVGIIVVVIGLLAATYLGAIAFRVEFKFAPGFFAALPGLMLAVAGVVLRAAGCIIELLLEIAEEKSPAAVEPTVAADAGPVIGRVIIV